MASKTMMNIGQFREHLEGRMGRKYVLKNLSQLYYVYMMAHQEAKN